MSGGYLIIYFCCFFACRSFNEGKEMSADLAGEEGESFSRIYEIYVTIFIAFSPLSNQMRDRN